MYFKFIIPLFKYINLYINKKNFSTKGKKIFQLYLPKFENFDHFDQKNTYFFPEYHKISHIRVIFFQKFALILETYLIKVFLILIFGFLTLILGKSLT